MRKNLPLAENINNNNNFIKIRRLTPNFYRRIYGAGQKFGGYGDWRRLGGLRPL